MIHSIRATVALLFLLVSCIPSQKTVDITSKLIPNFSDVGFLEYPEKNYFSEMQRLPYGFTLGGWRDHNSILFLTESANVPRIDDENVHLFLSKEEMKHVFETYIDSTFTDPETRRITYHGYSRLVTDQYVLLILNARRMDSFGRNYTFLIRTYDHKGNIIATLELARWIDKEEIYHGGMILPGMEVELRYNDDRVERYRIKENGEIEKS